MFDNEIYHVSKIIHNDVFVLSTFSSYTECHHLQLSFLLDATSQRPMAMCYMTSCGKKQANKNKAYKFNLKLITALQFVRYLMFEKKIYLILVLNLEYCVNKFHIFRMHRA